MTDRISCCVPFCRRTYHNREGFSEWLCQPHWSTTGSLARRVYRRRVRKAKADPKYDAKYPNAMWQVLKKQAIERACGI